MEMKTETELEVLSYPQSISGVNGAKWPQPIIRTGVKESSCHSYLYRVSTFRWVLISIHTAQRSLCSIIGERETC